jgi:hypothetical protein
MCVVRVPPPVWREVLLLDHHPGPVDISHAGPPLPNRRRPGWIWLVLGDKATLRDDLKHSLLGNRIPKDEIPRQTAFLFAHTSQPEAPGLGLKPLQRGPAEYTRQTASAWRFEGQPPGVVRSQHELFGAGAAEARCHR